MDPELPELALFEEETGIKVEYEEVIEEMGPWFARTQPQLAAGQDIGYDLMVITNGIQFKQFVQSNFLARLDHTLLPNYATNGDPVYKSSTYDPGNIFSVPWASGMTGLAYDPEKTGREITSFEDLFDPAFEGVVGLFGDAQELANFGLLMIGATPSESTPDDWREAAAKLQELKDKGILRNFYDQSYIDALAAGEVWITQAWSGDVLQRNISDGSNYQFVIPEEGGTIWTDNFTIPVTATNTGDVHKLIDFFYRPDVAATLAEYIGYVSPVASAKAVIQEHADEAEGEDKDYLLALIDSPLVFPEASDLERLHYYVDFESVAAQQEFESIFEPLVIS
jgi:spermidine/putrescine transport system substrate-binding protein